MGEQKFCLCMQIPNQFRIFDGLIDFIELNKPSIGLGGLVNFEKFQLSF